MSLQSNLNKIFTNNKYEINKDVSSSINQTNYYANKTEKKVSRY